MPLTKRVELLFDPDQFARLQEIARARRESVGALIREAVVREYLQRAGQEKQAALNRLLSQEIDFGPREHIKQDIATERIREALETPY